MKKTLITALSTILLTFQWAAAAGTDYFDTPSTLLNVKVLEEKVDNGVRLRRLEFDGRPLADGQTSRIYALYAAPVKPGKYPCILHIHGGGQTADPAIVSAWAREDYAAITFDWTGDMDGKIAGKRPFSSFGKDTKRNNNDAMFPTDGADSRVRDIIISARRAIDYLEQQPECDAKKLGVSGISWGGLSTWLLAGVEPRVTAIAPVYLGGKFGPQPYRLTGPLIYCQEPDRKLWLDRFDPANHWSKHPVPVLFLTGSNDIFFPLPGVIRLLSALPGEETLVVYPNVNHSLAFAEIQKQQLPWFNAKLKGAADRRPILAELSVDGKTVKGKIAGPAETKLTLYYLWSSGPAAFDDPKQEFKSRTVDKTQNNFSFDLPDAAPAAAQKYLCWYLMAENAGLMSSSLPQIKEVALVADTAPEPSANSGNLFGDPSLETQRNSGKNGPVYINAVGGMQADTTGDKAHTGKNAILVDAQHNLAMQADAPGVKNIRYAVFARGNEKEGSVQLQINFMNGNQLITHKVVSQKVTPDTWSEVVLETPVPEGTTRIFLFLQGRDYYADDLFLGEGGN